MRIGIFVSGIGVLPGYENSVSGHSQVALKTAGLLAQAGHEVHLLITLQHEGLVLPNCLPKGVPVHELTNGRNRGQVGVEHRRRGGYQPLAIFRQLRETFNLVHKLKLDILHLFGFERTVALAGLLRLMRLPCPTTVTAYRRPKSSFWIKLAKHAGPIVTATKHAQEGWQELGIPAIQLRHGVIRELRTELDSTHSPVRRRVLFWRILTEEAGGDLCIAAYDQLANQFPEISFDFALRPNAHEVKGVQQVASRHKNVNVFRYPYDKGESIAKYVSESLCALFPFRRLTIEPQLAIAETLAAGTACIGSNRFSIPELIFPGRTGELVNTDSPRDLVQTLSRLLTDKKQLIRMCENAQADFTHVWNWEHYVEQLEDVYMMAGVSQSCISQAA